MLEDLKLDEAYDGFLFLADSQRNPPYLKPHRHVELEVNLVVRGTITCVVAGRKYTFGTGTLLWFFPAQVHQLVYRSQDAQYYVGVFKPELIDRVCQADEYQFLKRKRPRDGMLSRVLPSEDYFKVRSTMESLVADGPDPDLLNKEAGFGLDSDFRYEHKDPDMLNAGLRFLLLQCWKAYGKQEVGEEGHELHPAVEAALSLVARDPSIESIEQIAKECGVSVSYLSRLFAREVGMPLSRYRNTVRLDRFLSLGRGDRKLSLLDAALEAGFGSYAQFYKVFVGQFGCGPRVFWKDRE
ncbi:AraC family transcriptional regulator [Pelagicoccus mobilis]|uniref:AraC family transcriptional regulator n=1 Tax=Pelagicoccus mobilis TaxID=415221 RepID=A0A934S055_9BACT|nr:AraC family transcriptional regulator [Pelagicoccus mobilis]MBK1878745.1 AraC family transcriptional regulator [Pelagicoccus mobilis]